MTIPFRVKKLTKTAKLPTQENCGDLFDLYADDFCVEYLKDCEEQGEAHIYESIHGGVSGDIEDYCDQFECLEINQEFQYTDVVNQEICGVKLYPQGRILIKTGIAIELPIRFTDNKDESDMGYHLSQLDKWQCLIDEKEIRISSYAVADIRPRSGLALKHGITVLNTPGTIDNSYRKEIGVILYNAGHEPYVVEKGDKIAQMLIRPLYPSSMEEVKDFDDTGRGGFGSTGK